MAVNLPVVNLDEATFECTFGRGCEGICCKNGRPPVGPAETARIQDVLPEALALMTPNARKLVAEKGFLSNRIKDGQKMLRVVDGWCVFFNAGCVLHTIGAQRGDAYSIKPDACALFPLEQDAHDNWYVRQWGYKAEEWDLFCLNPANTTKKAAASLAAEIELAERMSAAVTK